MGPLHAVTILIADGNNICMRSIHAMERSGLSVNGVPTGPLLVFINSVSRHIREEKPDRMVVCWDSGPSAFRMALDPNYKAHRKQFSVEAEESKHSSFSLAKEFLALANIHQVERPGFEADDLIAAYIASRAGERSVILSSDKDFLQLIDHQVDQVRLSSGGAETDRWTEDRVREEYGCEPRHLALAMALAGDVSDGVPGVPGFGMKTAIKVLAKSGWDLAAVEHPKVSAHRDQVDLSLQLVDLLTPVIEMPSVPEFDPTVPGSALYEQFIQFLTRYRMDSIKAKVFTNTLWKEPS